MPDSSRSSPWCQGDIFALRTEGGDELIGVVASHDCDLYADPVIEPDVEYLPVRRLQQVNGQFVYGKSPRKLHCRTLTDANEEAAVEMLIRERSTIDKHRFFHDAASAGIALPNTERVVFRGWLAARYARSAFPNAFEERLDNKLRKKIDALSEKAGKIIRGIYFDLDEREMIEREPGDIYQLRIHVVYETETDDDEVAYRFAQSLSRLFMDAFCDEKAAGWHDVIVLSCEAVSSYNFPLVLANALKPWRVDHRSYQQLPDTVFPEPGR